MNIFIFLMKGENMAMNSITNLLVWAHILSPSTETAIPACEDVAVKVHHYHKESKPVQAVHKPAAVVAPTKAQGPIVEVSDRLKTCLQQVHKAFPKYAWSKESKDLIARIAKSSQEGYEDLRAVIQECLKCVSAQKNDRTIRELYSNFEHCKRDLRRARAVALYLKAHEIKNKR